MHIPTFVFIFILFRTIILLLLLYPTHVIKLLGYNLGCYTTGLEDQVVIAWLRVTCLDVNVCALTC